MDAPPDKENCRPFVRVQALMAEARAERAADPGLGRSRGFMLLTDLGKQTLIELLQPENPRPHSSGICKPPMCCWTGKGLAPRRAACVRRALLRRELSLFPRLVPGPATAA